MPCLGYDWDKSFDRKVTHSMIYPRILQKISYLLSQVSVQTVLVVALYLLFAKMIPLKVHQGFYTVSLFIKDLLLWMMPLTVGVFIAGTIRSFKTSAPIFLMTLILFECASNFISVWYAYGAANVIHHALPMTMSAPSQDIFKALWSLGWPRPPWWAADKGVLLGMFLGLVAAFWHNAFLQKSLTRMTKIMETILTKGFARLIPLFVLGFAAHMTQSGLLTQSLSAYTGLFACLIFFLVIYLAGLFLISAGGRLDIWKHHVKALLPAGTLALTSGCSLSTMPWTITGTAKNLDDPHLAQAVIPATTNIQQIGDAVANAFFCFLIYTHFFGKVPDMGMWLTFSGVFLLARFATAAMLGGAIFVMLPIYETYLHFNGEMIALILALNVIFDPIITSCNVMANGALCRVFERVWQKITGRLPLSYTSQRTTVVSLKN